MKTFCQIIFYAEILIIEAWKVETLVRLVAAKLAGQWRAVGDPGRAVWGNSPSNVCGTPLI